MTGMRTFDELRKAHLDGPTVLTIGNFDGVHRGHQALLQHMQQLAKHMAAAHGTPVNTAFLTFDPHPVRVLRPDLPYFLLTTPMERLEAAAALGLTHGLIQPFNLEIAHLSPRDFTTLLKEHLGLATLVVGPDFALGRNRSGDIPTLRALGAELGFTVEVIAPITLDDHPVRSSYIRQLLSTGAVEAAATLLGRPYRVSGVVEHGDQRGRQVGIPTANLRTPPDKLLPADGVYATRTLIAGFDRINAFYSATNIGVRPTVDGLHRRVESHLLDFPPPGQVDDLYGRVLAVDFFHRLRGETRFATIAELVAQIHADIAQARAFFADAPATMPVR
ncbi:MAG TPA: hypothetical protein DCL15_09220 [Chloroflexi bacterium]|nr:hypothetical protein [Chloroflexota bacterium]